MAKNKRGCIECGPEGAPARQVTQAPGRTSMPAMFAATNTRPQTMFGSDTDNPLEPSATGNTLPFAANGLFRLPKHMVDDTPPHEPTLRPSPGMGMGLNAIFAEVARLDAIGRGNPPRGSAGQPSIVFDGEGTDESEKQEEKGKKDPLPGYEDIYGPDGETHFPDPDNPRPIRNGMDYDQNGTTKEEHNKLKRSTTADNYGGSQHPNENPDAPPPEKLKINNCEESWYITMRRTWKYNQYICALHEVEVDCDASDADLKTVAQSDNDKCLDDLKEKYKPAADVMDVLGEILKDAEMPASHGISAEWAAAQFAAEHVECTDPDCKKKKITLIKVMRTNWELPGESRRAMAKRLSGEVTFTSPPGHLDATKKVIERDGKCYLNVGMYVQISVEWQIEILIECFP